MLVLCEVLRWQASEVAELLETSVASVNSALQRARATLDAGAAAVPAGPAELGEADRELLERYVKAFEAYDMDALTSLIQEDAQQSMPPFDLWLSGRDDILTWWFGPGIGCQGSRVVPTISANGSPAFGQYKPADGGGYEPWALQVLEIEDGRIVEFTFFLDTASLFPLLRAAAAARGVVPSALVRQDVGQPHQARRARAGRPRRSAAARGSRAGCAASCSRASASTTTASGSTPATSQSATAAPLSWSSAQTRSQSPWRSARAIGPQIANATVCGASALITRRTGGAAGTHRRRER